MPYRRLPNTVAAVIRTLKTARDTWKLTPAADRAITAEHYAQLDEATPTSLLNRFLKEASDVDLALATQAPLTSQLSQTAATATMTISHFHQVLDLGIARGAFAAGARSYYGREVNATSIPDLSDYDAVAEAIEAIVQGEAARQAAEGGNYRPMALPSANDVSSIGYVFKTLRAQSQTALTNTDREREELQAIYAEAQALAVDICDTVEFYYRRDPDDSSRRVKCERWGVVYIFEPAAPTPPTPTPAPPAPPAPNP